MTMIEPIRHFSEIYPAEIDKIKQLVCGERYTAVLLDNGNIGICANLQNKVNLTINDLINIDYSNIGHRVALNAYYNALLNYNMANLAILDIFNAVNFKSYKQIVMIGYFRPLVLKFKEIQVPLAIFDMQEEEKEVMPETDKNLFLQKADAVILSATSIANNTFLDVLNNTSPVCDVFLLGPSSIIHPDMKQYKNVKSVFGSHFNLHDMALLELISKGYGTRDFLKFGRKVMY